MDIDREQFKTAFIDRLQSISGTSLEEAAMADKYAALASLIKDYIGKRWVNSNKAYHAKGDKQVYYFSIEFLLGRLLETNLYNLGDAVYAAAAGNSQMSHMNLAIRDNGHFTDALPLTGIDVPKVAAETLIYFMNNIIDAGQQVAKNLDRPLLKRFR